LNKSVASVLQELDKNLRGQKYSSKKQLPYQCWPSKLRVRGQEAR